MAGIISVYSFPNPVFITLSTLISVALFLCLLTVNYFYKTIKAYQFKGVIGMLFFVFCFVSGALVCLLHNNTLKENYFGNRDYQYLKISINNEPKQTNDILRFEAKVTTAYEQGKLHKTNGKLLVALKIDSLNPMILNYGDELLITAKYLPVEPAYNLAEFNFKAWLASQNIYHQTFINQNQIVKLSNKKGNFILDYAINERKKQNFFENKFFF